MSLNTNVKGKKFSPLTLSLSDFLVQQLDQLGHFLTKHKEKDTLPTLTSIFSEALTARSRIVIAQTRPTSPLAENGDCIRIQIWHFQWLVEPWRGHPDLWPYFFCPDTQEGLANIRIRQHKYTGRETSPVFRGDFAFISPFTGLQSFEVQITV